MRKTGNLVAVGLRSFLHLLRRDIFLVCRNGPDVAKRVLEGAGTITVELVDYRSQFRGARGDGLFRHGVHVLYIQAESDRCNSSLRRLETLPRRGSIGQHDVETPALIRYGQMTSDELFVTAEAAANGVVITNKSATENLVMLKHFGPGNPQAPEGRAVKR